MGLLKRMSNMIKGKTDRAVENMEKTDPDAIFRAAIEEKTEDIADLKELAREAKGFEMKEDQEIAECKNRMEALKNDLNLAVEEGDEEVGSEIIGEIEEVEAEIEVNKTEKAEYGEQFKRVNTALEAAKKELETLRNEQREAAQLEKSHKVMSGINDRLDGLGTDAMSKALTNARTRTNAIKADQAALGATKAASLASKREALRERAVGGKNKETFKAMLAKKNKKAKSIGK